MTTVILKPKKEESLRRFHPWVFSGAIARVLLDASHKGDAPVEGELVCVRSSANEILGIGHWQVGSIAVRILAFGVEQLPSDFWCERIRAAYKVREAIGLIRPDNNTFRLIHGEGDFLPGLIVDVYADTAVVQAHSIGMHESRNEIANALMSEIPQVQNVYYKSDDTLPFKASIEGDKTGWLITNHQSPITNGKAFYPICLFVLWSQSSADARSLSGVRRVGNVRRRSLTAKRSYSEAVLQRTRSYRRSRSTQTSAGSGGYGRDAAGHA